jgi:1,4-alpha-glucan branching enzyme
LTRLLVAGLCLAALVGWTAASVADTPPLGATPNAQGTTFRVWAPFVQAVAVKINGGNPVALSKEPGHADNDAVWAGNVPGAKPADTYRYSIQCGGQTKEFVDPRSQQLTGIDANASSVIVAPTFDMPAFDPPKPNQLVIYELHVGTFNRGSTGGKYNFAGTAEKLDYLNRLNVNAIELMPVHENSEPADRNPRDYNWGYDATQLFAVKAAYGTPLEFKQFVKRCHEKKIAVILDVVYNHLCNGNLLINFGGFTLPQLSDGIYFYGDARQNAADYGPRPDFGRAQVRQYIADNAQMWLRDYGIDGLRVDSTVNIRAYQTNNQSHDIAEGDQLLRETNGACHAIGHGKLTIAEDLQSWGDIVTPTSYAGGFGFDSQWDQDLYYALRRAVTKVNDADRDLNAIKAAIEKQFGNNVFSRVTFTENHDKVGHPNTSDPENNEIRLPSLIDVNNHESIFAKKRSTLAAAIMLTAPGIPMLFQGQEMLETRVFDFHNATPMDWTLADRKFPGIVQMYRDLIALRRNLGGKTAGLSGQSRNVFHLDDGNKTLAYHRWSTGGPGDDVVVVVNLSNQPIPSLNIGFPRGGKWVVRFNSGAKVYDPSFDNGDSFDTTANPGPKDNLNFNGNVGIGPYSVVILSQD